MFTSLEKSGTAEGMNMELYLLRDSFMGLTGVLGELVKNLQSSLQRVDRVKREGQWMAIDVITVRPSHGAFWERFMMGKCCNTGMVSSTVARIQQRGTSAWRMIHASCRTVKATSWSTPRRNIKPEAILTILSVWILMETSTAISWSGRSPRWIHRLPKTIRRRIAALR
nr:hypothetical protein Iba_chr14fCG9830 [Ipomoea batatas]